MERITVCLPADAVGKIESIATRLGCSKSKAASMLLEKSLDLLSGPTMGLKMIWRGRIGFYVARWEVAGKWRQHSLGTASYAEATRRMTRLRILMEAAK